MEYVIKIIWDSEAGVWVATNDYIPLAMEDESLDRLMEKVREVVIELVDINGLPSPKYLYYLAEARTEIYD